MHGKRFLSIALVLAAITLWAPVGQTATYPFFDNFNNENGGVGTLNYTGFANWTVSGGTVDLIGNGYFDYYPGHGLYVDLDGSTSQAGLMTGNPISLPGAGTYYLKFDLAGPWVSGVTETGAYQVVDHNTSAVLTSGSVTLTGNVPFAQYVVPFAVSGAVSVDLIFFEPAGTTWGDNMGVMLDNVQVVPIPPSALLLGSGLLGLVGLGWRRRKNS
jgi:hypothetical protein